MTYSTDPRPVDWAQLKAALAVDRFDNGRSITQLRDSFEHSRHCVFAYDGRTIIGTARCLSDGVCNAYIVDVWTMTAYRERGVATRMMRMLEAELEGQHVYLNSDDSVGFYRKLGYREQPVGLGKVVGRWLVPSHV